MQRRHFLAGVTQSLAAFAAAPALARTRSSDTPQLHLQDCRIAGSQYYDCEAVLPRLRAGDALRLQPQPDNPHAVEVFWRRHKLGYLPRLDNAAASCLLHRAHGMRAEILGIDDPDEAWEPVRLRIWVKPQA